MSDHVRFWTFAEHLTLDLPMFMQPKKMNVAQPRRESKIGITKVVTPEVII